VVPRLLADKPSDEPVRVWSAGCATGEEAYTLAMVLAEVLGIEAYRERVKIYATDIDEEALSVARQATYEPRATETLPEELRARYFERHDRRLAFRKDLRRTVIFGRNNLVSDAPISRLDLLVCRNTLMYFTSETQGRILRHFHFALREGGVLMLGRSEMMTSHRALFATEDVQKRVFRKLPQGATLGTRVMGVVNGDAAPTTHDDDDERSARDAALDAGPHAQLLVSRDGVVAFANASARALFGLDDRAIGRPLTESAVGREPVDLRGPVEDAFSHRRQMTVDDVTFTPADGEPRRLAVNVMPLVTGDDAPVGVLVSFEDGTRYATMQEELDRSRRDLEAAYEELESTIDELETTNEELQSANEELQTTNEELQSTNEELETMNEELQSTNEELEAINDELRERTTELNQVNEFLEVILTSLGVGVAVVDHSGLVKVWNRGAEELWGVRQDEAVEQHFLALDIGLDPTRLATQLRSVMADGEAHRLKLEAVNRRGRSMSCFVSVLPLVSAGSDGDGDGAVRGAIVLMENDADEGSAVVELPSRDGS
jgi:two-component system CheB/CheR fusion protein